MHGRWRSGTAKDGNVKDSVEKRQEVFKHLGLLALIAFFLTLCQVLLHQCVVGEGVRDMWGGTADATPMCCHMNWGICVRQ